MAENTSGRSPFDEGKFNDDVFSAPSFKEREKIIEEKRKMFEACESEEFRKNKEQMMERLRKQREVEKQEPQIETCIENVTEIPDEEVLRTESKTEEPEEDISEEEILTPDEIKQLVEEAIEYKTTGNDYYKEGRWEAAIQEYSRAISICPKSETVRSVFYANRAACWQNLLEYEKTVEDCTLALKLDNKYEKVLLRRADAYEKLEKLSEALADYKRILEINPRSKVAQKAVQCLPQQIQVKQEREKEEMMGKLKEVGNSLLGLVGLSLDNFQFKQDPNSGGYSVNFNQ